MDYARKIGKSTEPKKWVRQPPSILTLTDEPLCPDQAFKEDNRLKNWRRWLSDRKTQFDHVKSKTGRHAAKQVMNSCETVRPLVETRTIMDHAAQPLPVIPDKFRGGPEFWTIPPLIPKSDPCLPDIRFAPSKKDLNEAPEFVHVGLPELIEEEKGLAGLSCKKPLWKRSEYLKKRKVELLNVEMPPKPCSRYLVVKNREVPKKIEIPRVPPITISHAEDEESCEYPLQTAVLKIQDVEICQTFETESKATAPIRWNLTFSSKASHTSEKEIVFENKGNRVIVYQWRDANFRSKAIPLTRKISPFFFNKTKGAILPGQFVRLKVWYRSQTAGVFIESWRLITDPQLSSSPFIFRFWGHTLTNDKSKFTLTSTNTIDEYLDRCIRNSVIKEVIDEIMEDIYSVKPPGPAYGSLFLESEVFLAKNAMCFYSPSLLIEFRKIYRSTHSRDQWNLSIHDLRDHILRIKQHERRRQLLTQLNEVYKKCLMPTLYKPVRSNKHEAVKNLLAYLFNRFEIEGQMSKRTCLKEVNAVSGDCEAISRSVMNKFAYGEIFFIRVYQLLAETLEQIFASIDSFNNLEEGDK